MSSSTRGQSLVEMVVIIGVVVVLVTGIIAGTTVSLNRSKGSSIRTTALSFAQEGIELSRNLRDTGWNAFSVMGTTPTVYCVGEDNVFTATQGTCSVNIDNFYTRQVRLELISGSFEKMSVTSDVSWGAAGPQNTVTVTTFLTQWR